MVCRRPEVRALARLEGQAAIPILRGSLRSHLRMTSVCRSANFKKQQNRFRKCRGSRCSAA